MGMTIEEIKSFLTNASMLIGGPTPNLGDSCREAVKIIEKYQKIEQIIHDDWIKGVNSGATLNKIEEVLEDGDF